MKKQRPIKKYRSAKATSKHAMHLVPNMPGSKVARKIAEERGHKGYEPFHGGELTRAARIRSLERQGFQCIDARTL